jgi:hypothetical protein
LPQPFSDRESIAIAAGVAASIDRDTKVLRNTIVQSVELFASGVIASERIAARQ